MENLKLLLKWHSNIFRLTAVSQFCFFYTFHYQFQYFIYKWNPNSLYLPQTGRETKEICISFRKKRTWMELQNINVTVNFIHISELNACQNMTKKKLQMQTIPRCWKDQESCVGKNRSYKNISPTIIFLSIFIFQMFFCALKIPLCASKFHVCYDNLKINETI